MKKYTFKLEAVLKIKKFNEEKCRTELGVLTSELHKIKNQIAYDHEQIQIYFNMQNESVDQGANISAISFLPDLIEGKKANIDLLSQSLSQKEDEIEQKKRELASLRGELKLMEKLKEKDFLKYQKKFNKKRDEIIEEQTRNWLESLREKDA